MLHLCQIAQHIWVSLIQVTPHRVLMQLSGSHDCLKSLVHLLHFWAYLLNTVELPWQCKACCYNFLAPAQMGSNNIIHNATQSNTYILGIYIVKLYNSACSNLEKLSLEYLFPTIDSISYCPPVLKSWFGHVESWIVLKNRSTKNCMCAVHDSIYRYQVMLRFIIFILLNLLSLYSKDSFNVAPLFSNESCISDFFDVRSSMWILMCICVCAGACKNLPRILRQWYGWKWYSSAKNIFPWCDFLQEILDKK